MSELFVVCGQNMMNEQMWLPTFFKLNAKLRYIINDLFVGV